LAIVITRKQQTGHESSASAAKADRPDDGFVAASLTHGQAEVKGNQAMRPAFSGNLHDVFQLTRKASPSFRAPNEEC
jgi:hypothetical protein